MQLQPDGIPEDLIATVLVRSGQVRPAQLDDARALIFQMRQLGVARDLLGALVDKNVITGEQAEEFRSLAAQELARAAAALAQPVTVARPADASAGVEDGAPIALAGGGGESGCVNHPDQTAIATCRHCGKRICTECVVRTDHGTFCSQTCLGGWRRASAAKWAGRAAQNWMTHQVGRLVIVGALVGVVAGLGFLAKYLVDDYRYTSAIARAGRTSTSKKQAVVLLGKAVELRPKELKARIALGKALFRVGEVGRSTQTLTEVLDVDPGNVEALEGIAAAYMAKRRHREAAAALERLCDEGRSTYDVNRQLGMIYLEHLKRPEDAIQAFRAAIKVGSESRELRFLSGRALLQLGEIDDAREELRRAIVPVAEEEGITVSRERKFLTDKTKVSQIRQLLADVALKEGDSSAALKYLGGAQATARGSGSSLLGLTGHGLTTGAEPADSPLRLKVLLQEAEKFAEEQPAEFDRAITRFEKVLTVGRGTPFARTAEKRIAGIRERRKRAAVYSFEAATMKARALAEYDDFDGALAELKAVRGSVGPELKLKLNAEAGDVSAKARGKVEDIITRTRRKLGEGDLLGATRTLKMLSNLRFAPMKDEFGVRIKSLETRIANVKSRRGGGRKETGPRDFEPLHVLEGHSHPVTSATFGAGGSLVLTTSEDKTARVWDAGTGECRKVLKTYAGAMLHGAVSPDGRYVATASADKVARVWDVEGGRVSQSLTGHRNRVLRVSFSPDGRQLVTSCADGTISLWSVFTGDLTHTLKGHFGNVVQADFNAHGDRLLSASQDRTARIWAPSTGTCLQTMSGHEGPLTSAAYNPVGGGVVTASEDGTARIWESASGELVRTLKGHKGAVVSAVFSPDGRTVVTASADATGRIWAAKMGRTLFTLTGHDKALTCAAFSPDGRSVVTASRDGTARVWDAGTGKELTVLRGHSFDVTSASFSPDGRKILTASKDANARIWGAR